MMLYLKEVSKDFELNYGDMVGSFKESVQSQYPYAVVCTYYVVLPVETITKFYCVTIRRW